VCDSEGLLLVCVVCFVVFRPSISSSRRWKEASMLDPLDVLLFLLCFVVGQGNG